jgi:hypothetical protein
MISVTVFGISNQSARLITVPCDSLEDGCGACGFTLQLRESVMCILN